MCREKQLDVFLEEAARRGSVLGLDNMRSLMAELGDVQERLSVIHVAGTNGKGSVCAMTERALRLAGYRTGWYSSPQVFCREEAFRVDGRDISPGRLRELLLEVMEACGRMAERGLPQPTLFEVETAAAFLYFYQEKCEVVLLETGLGGSLDATNIIKKPLCSVITSVSRDHTKLLGEVIEEIASQKAGIIKEGCPTVSAAQKPEVLAVIRQACRERGSILREAEEAGPAEYVKNAIEQGSVSERERAPEQGSAIERERASEQGGAIERERASEQGSAIERERASEQGNAPGLRRMQRFDYKGYHGMELSLLGAYQPENAACAIETLTLLGESGFPVTEGQIRQGLARTHWPGRFEIVSERPLTALDGAHNVDAAKNLRKTLEQYFSNHAVIYIVGALEDKEYEEMLRVMLPLAERAYTVTPDSPRALDGQALCQVASRYHARVSYASSLSESWKRAQKTARILSYAGAEPMILAFGSLSFLGEMRRIMTGEAAGR